MTTNKICPQCGEQFDGRSNQTYCSSICKQRAFQTRQAQQGASHRANQSDSVSLGQPISSVAIRHVSEAEVELEELRLKQEESLKRLEFEERRREREYEAERQERLFQQEIEMAEIKTQSEKRQWEAERARFNEELKAKEKALAIATTPAPTPNIETDESEGSGAGWLLAGIAGLFLYRLSTQQPSIPEPPRSLQSFLPRPPIKPTNLTGLKTDSEPDKKTP